MINGKNIRLWCIAAVIFMLPVSCNDPVGEYYEGGSGVQTDMTVLEYLRSRPEYSQFVALLESTGRIEELREGTLLTVMAPTDETFPASAGQMTDLELQLLADNHLCLTMLYTRNLERLDMVRTLAGKSLSVAHDAGGYTVDGVELDQMDIVCTDGVLHRATQWLVPRLNLLQWITNLPDDYSIFRDSLLAYNTRRFDRQNSQIIGVDDQGRVIYDSVWVVDNPLLNNADLGSETVRYTLMAPSNAAFRDMYEYQTGYMDGINFPVTREDTVTWAHWVLKASLYQGVLDYRPGQTFTSLSGNQLRTDFNEVGETVEMSNGRVLKMSKSYVPKSVHMKTLTWNPYLVRRYAIPTGDNCNSGQQLVYDGTIYDRWEPQINNVSSKFDHANQVCLYQYSSNVPTDGANNYLFRSTVAEWEEDLTNVVKVNSVGLLNVFPGRYSVFVQLRKDVPGNTGNATNTLQFYNATSGVDVHIADAVNITAESLYQEPAGGLLANNVELTTSYGPVALRIRVPGRPTTGQNRRICIGNVRIVPSTSNY